jgi:hypothetical protein
MARNFPTLQDVRPTLSGRNIMTTFYFYERQLLFRRPPVIFQSFTGALASGWSKTHAKLKLKPETQAQEIKSKSERQCRAGRHVMQPQVPVELSISTGRAGIFLHLARQVVPVKPWGF